MNEVNARSMEICRRWGIADRVFNCPFPADFPLDVAFVTSLSGHELARLPRPGRDSQQPVPESPHRMQACSQIWFDPILKDFASSFAGVRLRHRCRLDAFEQSVDAVTAQITDLASGRQETLEADYLVGCDGAASLVRRTLGIEMAGEGTIGHPINLFFRAPNLIERCGKKPATFFLGIDETGLWGSLRIIDPDRGLWRLMIDSTDGNATPETVDREFYLRRALGGSFEVEWVDVNIWRRRSALAERYGRGRVWLAGDAVHQLSPTGGMGMNTGVADAADIGWKLAAVLDGWGGAGLLESYDLERRPIGERAVRMATWFYKNAEKFPKGSAKLNEDSDDGARPRKEFGEEFCAPSGRSSAPSDCSSATATRTRRSACRTARRSRPTIRQNWRRRPDRFARAAYRPPRWSLDPRSIRPRLHAAEISRCAGCGGDRGGGAAAWPTAEWSMPSMNRRPRHSTSASSCWCGRTAMSPGGRMPSQRTPCRHRSGARNVR